MQQIKLVEFGNLSHTRGQRQIIRRIVEQRIARHFDFVIMNVRGRAVEPNWLRVGNKVDRSMPALGQFKA